MNSSENLAILIADLGYGDAGKGSIVDYLARVYPVHTVIRYNGGAQAAHNVVAPDGRHHTFAQFGSGTLVPGVRTHLSRFMILHPLAMLAEERHLCALGVRDAFPRMSIDREALVITPFQQSANRLKEMARGEGRHGSCGMGVGETMSDWLSYGGEVLTAGDLGCREQVIKKLRFIRDAKIAQMEAISGGLPGTGEMQGEWKVFLEEEMIEYTADVYRHFAGLVEIVEPGAIEKILSRPGMTIFEGAQGVLLDEWLGFFPYNSWSTLTFKNADTLLSESCFSGSRLRLGLIRGYATRHGAGPFVTEDAALTAQVQDLHNQDNHWQRTFRVGHLDLLALRYALRVSGGVDGLVVTNLDRMEAIPEWRICGAYRYPGSQDLDGYFEREGELVRGILIPKDPTDLSRQEGLTRLLQEMQPVYAACERNRESYLERISKELDLPVAITSHGPTAREKENYLALDPFQGALKNSTRINTDGR